MDVDQASFGGLETDTCNDTVNDDVISSVQALLSQEKPTGIARCKMMWRSA